MKTFLKSSWHYIAGLATIGAVAGLTVSGAVTGHAGLPVIVTIGGALVGIGGVAATTTTGTKPGA